MTVNWASGCLPWLGLVVSSLHSWHFRYSFSGKISKILDLCFLISLLLLFFFSAKCQNFCFTPQWKGVDEFRSLTLKQCSVLWSFWCLDVFPFPLVAVGQKVRLTGVTPPYPESPEMTSNSPMSRPGLHKIPERSKCCMGEMSRQIYLYISKIEAK